MNSKLKLDDLFTDDERLDFWAEMMAMATAMQEYCDWWWRLDEGMRQANERRFNSNLQPTKTEEFSD